MRVLCVAACALWVAVATGSAAEAVDRILAEERAPSGWSGGFGHGGWAQARAERETRESSEKAIQEFEQRRAQEDELMERNSREALKAHTEEAVWRPPSWEPPLESLIEVDQAGASGGAPSDVPADVNDWESETGPTSVGQPDDTGNQNQTAAEVAENAMQKQREDEERASLDKPFVHDEKACERDCRRLRERQRNLAQEAKSLKGLPKNLLEQMVLASTAPVGSECSCHVGLEASTLLELQKAAGTVHRATVISTMAGAHRVRHTSPTKPNAEGAWSEVTLSEAVQQCSGVAHTLETKLTSLRASSTQDSAEVGQAVTESVAALEKCRASLFDGIKSFTSKQHQA